MCVATAAYATGIGWFGWAAALTAGNLVFNLYPILLLATTERACSRPCPGGAVARKALNPRMDDMDPEQDAMLTEAIAGHFPEARIADGTIDLGFGGLRLKCWVHRVQTFGAATTAHLFFNLSGGTLGPAPVFASVSGYADSERAAIVTGACNWACVFGPVLRAGLAGETQPEVEEVDATLDGQRFRVFLDGLDRALLFGDEGEPGERMRAARARFGGTPWLTTLVLESGGLPLLSSERPTILSVFVWDSPEKRVLEVKVNGRNWPLGSGPFAGVPPEPAGGASLLRELAVLVPRERALSLGRAPILRTLDGLVRKTDEGDREGISWHGWREHGGHLHPPIPPEVIANLEAEVGPLPTDYRAFLLDVAGGGAGPGYGLLPPLDEAQRELARGTFSWSDGEEPAGPSAGVLALAHAGCGIMWLLVLQGPHRGEVWLDPVGSDGIVRRVAGSFAAWYREWLDSMVRDATPWHQWNAACCATPSVLSKAIEGLERSHPGESAVEKLSSTKPGSTAIVSLGSAYFPANALLDACHPCVTLATRLGLAQSAFQRGVPPRQGMQTGPITTAKRSGVLKRLGHWFGGSDT